MNEGENTGMPTTPDFSSPNTSPNPQPAQPVEQPAAPAEPSVSDERPAAPAEQSASVYAAAASLPAEDLTRPSQTISSGNNKPAGLSNRFGFARKFKKQEPQQPVQPAFSNAPEYFNNAVQDIAIADAAADDAKRKRKKIALIAVAVLLVIGAGLGAFFLIQQANKPSANRVKTAFNRYANYVLYGEEKDSDIGAYSATTAYTILDKYVNPDENYNNRLKELFDRFYSEYTAAVESNVYKKDETIDGYKGVAMTVYYSFEMDKKLSLLAIYDDMGNKSKEDLLSEIKEKSDWYNEQSVLSSESWYAAMVSRVALAELYGNSGCLEKGEIDENCVLGLEESLVTETLEESRNKREFYESIVTAGRYTLYRQLEDIKELL